MGRLELPRLYPITATPNRHGWSHLELVRAYLEGGARLVQVRDKTRDDGPVYRELLEIREVCRLEGARLIVNDRTDLAMAAGADGVHLGQDDLPVSVARKMLGHDAIVGISTHTRSQFEEACSMPVDYIAVGPIFTTGTKVSRYEPLGVDFIRQAARVCPRPLVAIGGIRVENAERAWGAGVHSVAVISDLVNAPDPARKVSQFLNPGGADKDS